MRKISRHHAHHPDSGVPMCEIDMVTESGERVVLHQEGIASHPLSGRYTGDQIQIIEFIDGLLFNKKEPNMSQEEIDYLLFNREAIMPREKVEEKPKEPEVSAQPSIFGKSVPLVTEKPASTTTVFVTTPKSEETRIEGVSLDGSFYHPEPEPEPVVEEPVVEEVVVEEPVLDTTIVSLDVTTSEPVVVTKTKRKRKTTA